MYFTINLAFINYFGMMTKWNSNLPNITIDVTEQEQTLPLALQDLNPNDSVLISRPMHLTHFITKFQNNQKICVKQQRHIEMKYYYLTTLFYFYLNHSKFSFIFSKHLEYIIILLYHFIEYKNILNKKSQLWDWLLSIRSQESNGGGPYHQK